MTVELQVKQKSRHSFTIEEDQKLIKLVEKHGDKCNWKKISQKMPNRDARQCRDRWNHYLSPYNNSSEWKIEEDQLLMKLYDENGRKWSSFKPHFPGRTSVNIKSRWYKLNQKMLKSRKNQKSNSMILNNCNYKSNQMVVVSKSNAIIPAFTKVGCIMSDYSQMFLPNLRKNMKTIMMNNVYTYIDPINATSASGSNVIGQTSQNFESVENKRESSAVHFDDLQSSSNQNMQQIFNDIPSSKISDDDDDFFNFFEPDLQGTFFF